MTDVIEPGASRSPRASAKLTEIEQHGIDTIPESDRDSGPWDFFRIQFGSSNTFATILLGTISIALGLSFWAAIIATALGVAVGALVILPMALFGPLTGTNNAVSSGAHFGVKGRVIGSFLSLITSIAFLAISVWVSGDAVVGALIRVVHAPDSNWLRAFVYIFFGALIILVVVYGYQLMLFVNKITTVANTILILLGIVAFADIFHADYNPGPDALALGSFWPTFILAALIAMGNPVAYGAFLGDWSRYFPRDTSRRSMFAATFFAQIATLLPFYFGVATATLVAGATDYVGALVNLSPIWYAFPLVIVAILGGIATGASNLYGTGLDFSSVFPALSRVKASIAVGLVSFVFVLVGRLVYDTESSVNAFIGVIIVCAMPWLVIMSIGFWTRRGYYRPVDLQVFNIGMKGGAYWFDKGTNWRGVGAWIPTAAVSLLFCNYPPLIEGPFRNIAGGVDLSLPVSLILPAIIYFILLFLFPEPRYVYGPDGPRFVPAKDTPEPEVVEDPRASKHRQIRRNRAAILTRENEAELEKETA